MDVVLLMVIYFLQVEKDRFKKNELEVKELQNIKTNRIEKKRSIKLYY